MFKLGTMHGICDICTGALGVGIDGFIPDDDDDDDDNRSGAAGGLVTHGLRGNEPLSGPIYMFRVVEGVYPMDIDALSG